MTRPTQCNFVMCYGWRKFVLFGLILTCFIGIILCIAATGNRSCDNTEDWTGYTCVETSASAIYQLVCPSDDCYCVDSDGDSYCGDEFADYSQTVGGIVLAVIAGVGLALHMCFGCCGCCCAGTHYKAEFPDAINGAQAPVAIPVAHPVVPLQQQPQYVQQPQYGQQPQYVQQQPQYVQQQPQYGQPPQYGQQQQYPVVPASQY